MRRAGPDPARARLAMILVHGRNAAAANILDVARLLDLEDIAYLAPEAAGHTWYPKSFLAPMSENEPELSSGLGVLADLIASLEAQGLPSARIGLLGFSQGACLALEFAARHARRYAAVIGLSGGVIGPPGTARDYRGSMEGTRVLLACSNVDSHIPLARVHETADVFRHLGATVLKFVYPGMAHAITDDEIEKVRQLLKDGH
ncbi:MAG TPA: dienelactone hydrolase family protein [Vicinamibacterales bacterium]|nr:dienelactone hydrolase family protein [Vicinamibacterales bacterium]